MTPSRTLKIAAIALLGMTVLPFCGRAKDVAAASSPPPATRETKPKGAVKWHPGHYVFNAHPEDNASIERAIASPYITGVQVRYFWRDLETSKGVYNFKGLEENLKYLQAHGKRLHLLVFDQDYWGKDAVPSYMLSGVEYGGGQVKAGRRVVPRYWDADVMDRLIALYCALGDRFDQEPYFEAISTHETAVGSAARQDTEYDDDAYVTQLKREQTALVEAFPTTLAFMSINWCPAIDDVIHSAYEKGLGIAGPDLILGEGKRLKQTQAYPYYAKYHGKMPLEIGGQMGLIASVKSGTTMAQLFDFAITDPAGLRVSHMDWNFPYGIPGFTFDGTILPYIEAKEGLLLNTAYPENLLKFRGGVKTD